MKLRRAATLLAIGVCLVAGTAFAQQEATNDIDSLLEEGPAVQTPGEKAAPAPSAEVQGGLESLEGLGGTEAAPEKPAGAANAPAAAASAGKAAPGGEAQPAKPLTLQFNGYLKPLVAWESVEYPSAFSLPPKDRFTTVGARTQFLLQGKLRDQAQFFTAANLDFNEVNRSNDTASSDSQNGKVRMVESYIDLFGETSRWRVGSQIVTWGYMDGFEVPTDRLGARDFSYKSSELEDIKLASTAVQFTWNATPEQKVSLFYIPVSKVNTLAPDFERVFVAAPDDQRSPGVRSGDSKYALSYNGTVGWLDYALTWVDGTNPAPDLGQVQPIDESTGLPEVDSNGDPVYDYYKTYHRYRSPGLALQINFGSVLGRVETVWYDTGDVGNHDPLRQNDWSQYMVGLEFWLGSALVDFNAGQKTVANYNSSSAARFQNVLLGQVAETSDIVAGIYTDNYFTGDALELNVIYSFQWDHDTGKLVQANFRPSFAYNLSDGLTVTLIPAYSEYIGIKTKSIYLETKLSF